MRQVNKSWACGRVTVLTSNVYPVSSMTGNDSIVPMELLVGAPMGKDEEIPEVEDLLEVIGIEVVVA